MTKKVLQREALDELIRLTEELGLYEEQLSQDEVVALLKRARHEVAEMRRNDAEG